MEDSNFKYRLILVNFKNIQYKQKFLQASREKKEVVKSPFVFENFFAFLVQ